MAFGFHKNRLSSIAIDPGADQIKLLQVAGHDPPGMAGLAAEAVPAWARHDNEARQQFLADVLPRLLQQGGFRGRRAMCAIPAFQTFAHQFDIATGEKVSREEQLNAQIRERLNLEPTRLVMRSFDVGPVQRESGQCQRVLCLAAKREQVMAYVELARRCRLEVVGMHSEPLCMLRAFEHTMPKPSAQANDEKQPREPICAYIDLGAATTKVVVARGTQMIFSKMIQAGGNQAVRAVAKARSLNFDQARQAHMADFAGTNDTDPTPSHAPDAPTEGASQTSEAAPTSGGPALAEPADADAEAFETVLDELQLCVRYQRRVFPQQPIEKLIFVGGQAQRRDRCRALGQRLGLPVQLGNPLVRLLEHGDGPMIGIDPTVSQPGWATPVGLCFSEANW
jgi:Tfp pilus assembly PilM family ATPase